MMTTTLLPPRLAALRHDDSFYCESCWRRFPMVNKIQRHIADHDCGTLRSLRFTAMRPRKNAATEEVFLLDRFASMLDAAEQLAESETKTLFLEKAPEVNSLFGLAQFDNGITAEFECNECLPDSMPDIAFVKANFTDGHATNQPLVGYFNEDGLLFADDCHCRLTVVEAGGRIVADSPFQWMKLRFAEAVERAEIPTGNLGMDRLHSLIKGALQ